MGQIDEYRPRLHCVRRLADGPVDLNRLVQFREDALARLQEHGMDALIQKQEQLIIEAKMAAALRKGAESES